jgi:L-lactate dehydrogenase (cytochrome)
MSVELFGERCAFPIALAPVSSQASMGKVATALVSRATETLQIHSTFSPRAIEKVNEAYDSAVWFQLYASDKW